MRLTIVRVLPALVVISLLSVGWRPPAARADAACGSESNDAADVAAARAAAAQQCDCATATNHGQYVSCVTAALNSAVAQGQLRPACRGGIVRCAARSACGRPGFVACCRRGASRTHCSVKRSAAACRASRGGSACVSDQASCCDACSSGSCPSAARLRAQNGGNVAPGACNADICRPQILATCGAPGTTQRGQCLSSVLAACRAGEISCGVATTTTTSPTTSTTAATATSTTSAPTTTTSPGPVCGNGIVEPGEQCDPPGSLTCPPASPGGAMLECQPGCVCGSTTTTTVVGTTSTTGASTTTTIGGGATTTTTIGGGATTTTTIGGGATTTTTATTPVTTTTIQGFTQLSFTTAVGTASCGSAGLVTPPPAPTSGQLNSDTGCATKIVDLGLGCLYFGGGAATG